MDSHVIDKPIVFISHATSDAEFADAVKSEIEKVFAEGLKVYCTSSPGSIPAGSDWLDNIESNLNYSKAIIPIITPISIERPWLWFEVGATWAKGKSGACKIYPLCAAEINTMDLPAPLNRLQALSLGKTNDLKMLFEALISQFGFGKITSFKASNIIKRIPKYKDVKILDIDKNEQIFYSGKYSEYTDDELVEVIESELFEPEKRKFEGMDGCWPNREDLLYFGKLIHYKEIDQRLNLPPGTAKRLIKIVAAKYKLIPKMETDNIVRFKIK